MPTRPIRRPRYPRAFQTRVRRSGLTVPADRPPTVTDADLAGLPEPAQRYLRFMGVPGAAADWSFRASFTGRFRLGPDKPWLRCTAWQYNSRLPVARLFRMRIWLGPLPMTGWDTYLGGVGRMRGKLLGLVTVADGSGPTFDRGELVTYLNDAVLLAPSMLLDGHTTWRAVDADSFDVGLTDGRHQVTARVFVDADGSPRDFHTDDRTADLPDGPVKARWSTPVERWVTIDGRPRPTVGRAVWHLPDGPLTYAEFAMADGAVAYNRPPGA